jgi:hypothetical protein
MNQGALKPQVWIFLATVVCGIAGLWFMTATSLDARRLSFDLRKIAEDQTVVSVDVPFWIEQAVKVGNLERNPPPRVGVFGDHTAQFFNKSAFGSIEPGPDYFFNQFVQTFSLPEMSEYIDHVAKIGKLPDLSLIQVPNPRVIAGKLLIERRTPGFDDILVGRAERGLLDQINTSFLGFTARLDWMQVISAVFPTLGFVVFSPSDCAAIPDPGWKRFVPGLFRRRLSVEDLKRDICANEDILGFRNDGSRSTTPQLVDDDLPRVGVLQPHHTGEIANRLAHINQTITAQGKRVVFFVPPVDRQERDTPLDRVLSDALVTLNGITVLDMRFGGYDHSYFNLDAEHPGTKFYGALVEELRKRGLLEASVPNPQQ